MPRNPRAIKCFAWSIDNNLGTAVQKGDPIVSSRLSSYPVTHANIQGQAFGMLGGCIVIVHVRRRSFSTANRVELQRLSEVWPSELCLFRSRHLNLHQTQTTHGNLTGMFHTRFSQLCLTWIPGMHSLQYQDRHWWVMEGLEDSTMPSQMSWQRLWVNGILPNLTFYRHLHFSSMDWLVLGQYTPISMMHVFNAAQHKSLQFESSATSAMCPTDTQPVAIPWSTFYSTR